MHYFKTSVIKVTVIKLTTNLYFIFIEDFIKYFVTCDFNFNSKAIIILIFDLSMTFITRFTIKKVIKFVITKLVISKAIIILIFDLSMTFITRFTVRKTIKFVITKLVVAISTNKDSKISDSLAFIKIFVNFKSLDSLIAKDVTEKIIN